MSDTEGREFFQFMAYCWDVTAALQLAETLPVQRLHAEPLFRWLPLISVDVRHAAQVSLDRPLLVVTVGDLDGVSMVIDGWHRLYRAHAEALTHLPCLVLDEDQELQVRVLGGRKGHVRRAARSR
ncbi:hypothetical protein P8605_02705 [Streptomyces sp. T-3]|nr:hypothetical protein [Streptomyces sp. T-3]